MDTVEEALQWSQIVGALNAIFFRGALDKKPFNEDDIKRGGNPKNRGQFSEQGGGGSKKAKKSPAKEAKPKTDAKAPKKAAPAKTTKAKQEPKPTAEKSAKAKKEPVRSRFAGEPRKMVTPDGKMEVTAQPEVIELADLIHAKGDLQPRNRDTAESRTTARERASKLDPERLKPGRSSDAGAPVIDADGTIISGNGRVMSIREAYASFKDQSASYRKALGKEAKGMKQPVLVMRLPKGMSHAELVEFADRSNRSHIESMSATERARRDAKAAGPDIVGLYRGGDFTSGENRPFMHAFTQKVMTANERAQFSKEGRLTKEGSDRLSAAVLASAYDDVDALSLMLESTDDNVKSITNAMKDTAGRFAELKAGVAAGSIKPDMDVTAQIADAAKLISNLRRKGVSPSSHFAQIDAFSMPDPMVEALVKAFYTDNLAKAISQQKITAILGAYADEAIKHQPGGFLPDDTKASEVLSLASRKVKAEREPETRDLFGSNAGNEPGNGKSGEGNGRRGTAKSGGRTSGKGQLVNQRAAPNKRAA